MLPNAKRATIAGLFLAPTLLTLGVTTIYPVVYAVVISMFDWNWGSRSVFVGLQNYQDLVTSGRFWRILAHTVYFAAGAVALEFVIGFALALAVSRITRGATIIRALLTAPLMLSGIIVALMAKVILDPTLGIANYLLRIAGLPVSSFFGAPNTAMPSIILVDTWWQSAFVFVVMLAGIQSLPQEPFEAAIVDGATRLQRFRYIALPLLRPIIVVVLVFRGIDCLKVFSIVFGTTGGGPDIATEVVQTHAYRTGFKVLQIGDAMAIMVLFSAMILAIALAYARYGAWRETQERPT